MSFVTGNKNVESNPEQIDVRYVMSLNKKPRREETKEKRKNNETR